MAKVRITIILVIFLLAAGFGIIFVAKFLAEPPERAEVPPQTIHVTSETISRGDVTEQLRGFGLVRPARRANVAAQVSGTITSIPQGLREGVKVERGQLLAEIDPIKYTTELARREASLTETEEQLSSTRDEIEENKNKLELVQADLELARNDLRRTEQLFQNGAVGESQLDAAKSAVQLVEQRLSDVERQGVVLSALERRVAAQIQMREQEIESARVDVERSAVRAPFAGVIEERFVDEGDLMNPGTRLFALVDMTDLELPIEIPASQASALKIGASVALHSDEQPPRTAEGMVARISPTINPQNRTVSAWIRIENGAEAFVPGTFLSAAIAGRTFEDVYPVLREAIVDDSIFLAQDGKALRIEPEFFVFLDELALTRDEIGTGPVTLITSGFERLYNGAPIDFETDEPQDFEAAPPTETRTENVTTQSVTRGPVVNQ